MDVRIDRRGDVRVRVAALEYPEADLGGRHVVVDRDEFRYRGQVARVGRRGGWVEYDESPGPPQHLAVLPPRLDRARARPTARQKVGGDDVPDLAAPRVILVKAVVGKGRFAIQVVEVHRDAGQVAEGEVGHYRAVDGLGVFAVGT